MKEVCIIKKCQPGTSTSTIEQTQFEELKDLLELSSIFRHKFSKARMPVAELEQVPRSVTSSRSSETYFDITNLVLSLIFFAKGFI
jgi:hypothetical protein